MDKKNCAEAFIVLNKTFASKYQDAWIKLFKRDENLSIQWIQAFVDDGIDCDIVEKTIFKVKADARYADYPPNLSAFIHLALSVKFSNILDDEDAYLHFCTNKSVSDKDTEFLISRTIRVIGAHRLKTIPNLVGSFKKIYNKNRAEFITGGLNSEYELFVLKNEKSHEPEACDGNERIIENPALIVDRLKEISCILKK